MKQYLKEVNKLISSADGANMSILVVNRDGVIEYHKPCNNLGFDEFDFGNSIKGKRLLDVYHEITEENSTVIKTLKTGKITVGENQVFTTDKFRITLSTTTYPILDEHGAVQGAIDVARLLQCEKNNVQIGEDIKQIQESALDSIITQNDEMKMIKRILPEIARNDSPVLIYGETGTGKELIAQALHKLSNRCNKPFISQNCAAIPEKLLESIFFGTEKGGFTGAESKPGLFQMADGGTLFLDEINSMNKGMQAKLLKVLEEQKARRIGGARDISFNVRIISATNERIEDLVNQGSFRSDFYYRIGVVRLLLPPLRNRKEDILLLTDKYIDFYNRKMKKQIQGLSQMSKQLFLEWDWPGNVRELKNTLESAFNMENGEVITLDSIQWLFKPHRDYDVPSIELSVGAKSNDNFMSADELKTALIGQGIDLKLELEKYENFIITLALKQNRKLTEVAKKLNISPQKLQYRMEKFHLKE